MRVESENGLLATETVLIQNKNLSRELRTKYFRKVLENILAKKTFSFRNETTGLLKTTLLSWKLKLRNSCKESPPVKHKSWLIVIFFKAVYFIFLAPKN